MEKTKNKFYLAVAILEFVGASLSLIYLILMIMGLASGTIYSTLETELLSYYGGRTPEMLEEFELTKMVIISMTVFTGISAVVMYISGAYFIKYSNQTNQEAAQNWGKCLAWVSVAYMFGGLLLGGLATAGLCAVQAKQKNSIQGNNAASVQNVNEVKNEDFLSVENLEKLRVRLEKLKLLKDSGALTEEEYQALRSKLMHRETPKEEEVPVDPETAKLNKMTERLNKLNELKAAGAITEEEFSNLREKVINENN